MQQRLLGAAILVALLVIVVPEWLDGAGYRSRYPGHVEIPEAPEFKPLPQPSLPPLTEAAPAVEPAAEDAAPKSDGSRADASIQAWALQVGSFSAQANAMSLRDSLRAKGYAAYVEEQKSASGTQFRVRIGPELDRARIDALQKKISEQDKLNGVVVKHP